MINTSSLSPLCFAQNYNLRTPRPLSFSSNYSINDSQEKENVPLETLKAYTLVSFEGKNKLSFPEQLADTARNVAESMNTEGSCKKGVRLTLEKHGIPLKGISAYMASDQFARSPMFTEIKLKRSELIDLKPGTVVVWDKCPGHQDGHISIALGNGKEASDCIRDQFTDYGPRFRVFEPNESNTITNKLISRPKIALLHKASRAKQACLNLISRKADNVSLSTTES